MCVLLPGLGAHQGCTLKHHMQSCSSPLQIYMKHLTACRLLARLPCTVSIRFDMRGVSVWYTVRPGSGSKGRSTYGKQGFQLEGELPILANAACAAADRAEAAALPDTYLEADGKLAQLAWLAAPCPAWR